MRALIRRTGHASDKIVPYFSRSKLLLVGSFLIFIMLATVAITVASKSHDSVKVAAPASAVSEPIPQMIVIGHRMMPEQKRQFDEADAMATKAATTDVAGLQNRQK